MNIQIKLFEEKQVRSVWNEDEEEWYFSVVDVVEILTESKDPKQYIKKIRSTGVQFVPQFKWSEKMVRIEKFKLLPPKESSVSSNQFILKKAEPFKLWIAQVAKERLDEMQDPEQGIQRALLEYQALGYSENWINQRLKSIEIRKDLTDEWKKHGLQEGIQFATLTDIIYKTWAGKTAKDGIGKIENAT